MSEINMDFSFPAAPASVPSTSVLAAPFGHPQRPLSFSPQSRPRKHAHRRSAAMSEDLSATDLSTLTAPQLASTSLGLPPSPGSSPGSLSRRSSASSLSAGLNGTGAPSTGSNGTGSGGAANGSGSVSFAPLPSPQVPQVPQMPAAAEASGPRRSSFDLRDSRPRMPFAGSPTPVTPLRRLGNVGEPGQLVPASPSPSPSSLPSPREDGGRRKHSDRAKRRSFVRVFKRSRDFDSGGDDTLTCHDVSDPAQAQGMCSPLAPPPPTTDVPRTPEMSSPILTPRNSGEVLRDLEPEPPSIDLDEALSCSFDHRRPEGILDSPFSKASSTIGPVPEEEEESEADSLSSVPKPRSSVMLHRANSVHSTSSFNRSAAVKPSPRLAHPAPILVSPFAEQQQQQPLLASSKSGSAPRPIIVAPKEQDHVSHLAITEPKDAPLEHNVTSARPVKGHARRRSLISRLMGRHH